MPQRKAKTLVIAAIGAAMLGGCAAPLAPVSVTRFHADDLTAPAGQAITVRPASASDDMLEMAPYLDAVTAALTGLGYAPAPDAKLVAEVAMRRDVWQPGRERGPVSVGVGGSTGSYGSGVGVGVGIDLSGPPPEQTATRLSVTIRDEATGLSVWEGRADQQVARKNALAQPAASARVLADALFVDFPGESGESYDVKQD